MHRDEAARGEGVPDRATQLALERNYRIQTRENIMWEPGRVPQARFPESNLQRDMQCNFPKRSKPGITNDFS